MSYQDLHPGTRLALLSSHHVWDVPLRQGQILALGAAGFDDGEIAARLGLAEHTVRNHGASGRLRVVPPALEPTRANACAWCWLHRNCCMATLFAGLWAGACARDAIRV